MRGVLLLLGVLQKLPGIVIVFVLVQKFLAHNIEKKPPI